MKIAVIYDNKDGDREIYVQFDKDKFRELLKKYMDKFDSIDQAMDQIEKDIKQAAKEI